MSLGVYISEWIFSIYIYIRGLKVDRKCKRCIAELKAAEIAKTHDAIIIHPDNSKYSILEYKQEDIYPNQNGYFRNKGSVGPYARRRNAFDGVAMVLYEDDRCDSEVNRYGTKLMGGLGCSCGHRTVRGPIIACFYDNGIPINGTIELFKEIADKH